MRNIICAFNIMEERFKLIQPPPTIWGTNYNGIAFSLGLFGNSLCVFDNSKADTQLDTWTMKEYGIVDCGPRTIFSKAAFHQ